MTGPQGPGDRSTGRQQVRLARRRRVRRQVSVALALAVALAVVVTVYVARRDPGAPSRPAVPASSLGGPGAAPPPR